MSIRLRLDDVRRAWDARDPELIALIVDLTGQEDRRDTPIREGVPTFDTFLAEIRSKAFLRKPLEEQAIYRREAIKALEAPSAEVPLPDRFRLHEILLALWADDGPFARSCLLAILAEIPRNYGPWRALKRIFKEAEARDDTEMLGALAAWIDSGGYPRPEVGSRTLAYLQRRGWRYLRRIARERPVCYADTAADFLARYGDDCDWDASWIANHVFFHDTKAYTRTSFRRAKLHRNLLKDRAFADLWKRSPRPLFGLLERARSDRVREFAAEALKADFRASLRDVEPSWVARLVGVNSEPVDAFVVWILKNVPRFEQGAFRELGLHEAVLRLFDSESDAARAYAAEYARTHARDLPVAELIRLADNDHDAVQRLALDLLQSRDPRSEVGLEAWGRLLETDEGHELAAKILIKHFGASELTPAWFQARLLSGNDEAFEFASGQLGKLHSIPALGPSYFAGVIEAADALDTYRTSDALRFATDQLAQFDLNLLDSGFLRRLLLRPGTTAAVRGWVEKGRLKPQGLGLDFLKALAFHPDWESDPWLVTLRGDGPSWARTLTFDESLADLVLGWLGDVRRFAPADLGFAWLFRLAARSESRYHAFAVETMSKGFIPADFAPTQPATTEAAPAATAAATIDLAKSSFLFTGKLATMQRKEAEDKVKAANGTVASGVNAKLHYLVIGDEGSPLYGHGKKGSKQLKAEELNAGGANLRIISETAFLKMLAGHTQEVSADATLEGCERIWGMALAPGAAEAALARFALRYVRRHHPDIALAETDRPVDPGAEFPAAFLSFERVEPLFAETRKPLRDLALDLARWEFARWSPSADALVRLAESPHPDVRAFVAQALLADDAPEHRRYRINPESLEPAAVYRFCESADESTRALGLRLIQRSDRLKRPEELFRLTESPDRQVRAFVIRALWSLYRDRGITDGWKPSAPPPPTMGAAAKKAAAQAEARGTGPPARPEQRPAEPRRLWDLLRRTLFELPPARPEKVETSGERLRPLPARRAKLGLIETLRDLALDDPDFARGVLPLLDEFLISRGRSEHDACLVAVTRIRHQHPTLRQAEQGVTS